MRRASSALALAAVVLAVAACQGSPAASMRSTSSPPSISASARATATASPTPALTGPTTGPGGCSIPAPATPPSGLTLYTCYTVTGVVTGSGGFIDPGLGAGALSCADWAQSGQEPSGSGAQGLQAPDPGDAQVTLNSQDLGFDLQIVPYTGPGAYASTTVAQSVSLGTTLSWSTNFAPKAIFAAQVNPDGSGSVTISGLANDSSNGTTLSVSESWVCVMATGS